LHEAIDALATAGEILVASDYDGTLAPLVDDPSLARPHPRAIAALHGLAALDHTHVALVSGRSLEQLARLSGLAGTAILIGSHGSEVTEGTIEGLDDRAVALRDRLVDRTVEIARHVPGARVEPKPAGVAFHTREVRPTLAPEVVETVLAVAATESGVGVKHGKDVVELTVVDADKGTALQRLRRSIGVDVVLFVGDDLTDEDAFTALDDHDVTVKVGPGTTMAAHRVPDVDAVAALLTELLVRRRRWVQGSSV
jgi:trehalose-phosphatase